MDRSKRARFQGVIDEMIFIYFNIFRSNFSICDLGLLYNGIERSNWIMQYIHYKVIYRSSTYTYIYILLSTGSHEILREGKSSWLRLKLFLI